LLIECIVDAMAEAEKMEREIRRLRNTDLSHEAIYLSDFAVTFADSWRHKLTDAEYQKMADQFIEEAGMYASDQVEIERDECATLVESEGKGLSARTIADLIRARSNTE
jgi:hypothetical protein